MLLSSQQLLRSNCTRLRHHPIHKLCASSCVCAYVPLARSLVSSYLKYKHTHALARVTPRLFHRPTTEAATIVCANERVSLLALSLVRRERERAPFYNHLARVQGVRLSLSPAASLAAQVSSSCRLAGATIQCRRHEFDTLSLPVVFAATITGSLQPPSLCTRLAHTTHLCPHSRH